jgi:hypothetical protein
MAVDIQTGERFEIAVGEANQGGADIAGSIVVWREHSENSNRLMILDLQSGETSEVANFSEGVITQAPAAGDQHIVWAETRPDGPNQLIAYEMATGELTTIAEFVTPGVSYSVSSTTLLWNSPQLHMTDLATGDTQLLDERAGLSPYLDGDRVIWSSREMGGEPGHNLYGMDLQERERLVLIEDDGSQTGAQGANGQLIWRSDAEGYGSLHSTSFDVAFESGSVPELPEQSATAEIESNIDEDEAGLLDHSSSFTRPTYKGMHTANGGGWFVIDENEDPISCTGSGCPAIDSLGAPFSPFFGSLLVLHWEGPGVDSDLDLLTGRSAPWGPTVADGMEHRQSTWGTRVVVRLSPEGHDGWGPDSGGTVTPDDVAQQLISLVDEYPWIEHVQIHNEPNHEWPQSCTNCTWPGGSTYSWYDGIYHSSMYDAINDFYSDAWWAIEWYKTNHPEASVRSRLQEVEIWSPPMADIFQKLDYGDDSGKKFYELLHGMIGTYDRMTYHTYPAPNYNADGIGGIENNSWTESFDSWVRNEIDSGLRTMITEFGWNPGQMTECLAAQHEPWTATQPGPGHCPSGDAQTHLFDEDLDHFLDHHRHDAEAVMVWITRGWSEEADGIEDNGDIHDWYHNYQWSSP